MHDNNDAASSREQAIRAAIDYAPHFPAESIISHRYEEQMYMKAMRRRALWGLAVMACAYFFEDWLGEWAFWLGVVGDVCVMLAFAGGLKHF